MAKKSDYSLFIDFFLQFIKKIGLFIIFLGSHYPLFIIKKSHYSLIIIPHPDPLVCLISLKIKKGHKMLSSAAVVIVAFRVESAVQL